MMFASNQIKVIIPYLMKQRLAGRKLKKRTKKNQELVETKKIEIERIWAENREEIEAGKLVVYMIDECHLLWGDVCGYVWGKTKIRIEVPMTN